MDAMITSWKRVLTVASALTVLTACAGSGPRRDAAGAMAEGGRIPSAATVARESPGEAVERHLRERFAGTRRYCGKTIDDPNRLPAVLCSGILLRATKRGAGYDAWNPNPLSPTPNGVPFSWLRQDSTFNTLVFSYTNGFIILPRFFSDSPGDGYTQLTVRCVFPFDGATNGRTGDDRDGCGKYLGNEATRTCQLQGVYTEADWTRRFGTGVFYGSQCGFRLLPGTPDAWQAFDAQSEIRRARPHGFSVQNEVIVGTWAQNDVHLPLEAFFYVNGVDVGLAEAKANQKDFRARTGRWVPVIRIDLPATQSSRAGIYFNPGDQGTSP